jgi:hypothetical protein
VIAVSWGLVDDFAVGDGETDGGVLDFFGRDGEEIGVEDDNVCEFAGSQGAFFGFSKFGVGRAHGIGLDGFGQGDFLFGEPASGVFAV